MENTDEKKPRGRPSKLPKNYEQLAEARKATQFKEGNKPVSINDPNSNKPWSIRNQMRLLAAKQFTATDPKAITKELKDHMRDRDGKTCTGARLIAIKMFEKVIKNASGDMTERFIENVEGKLTNYNTELPPPPPLPEDSPTEEEAAAAFAEYSRQ